MATRAGISEARRVFANPEVTGPGDIRIPYYRRLWDYYSNQAFEDLELYEQYRAHNRLSRNHRSIYNPANRIVKAYEGFIYGGILTADARRHNLPEGVPLAVMLGEDTSPSIRAALGQLWRWSNWQQNGLLMVRYTAALGNCLVEVVDDIKRRKVSFQVWYPGMVKRIDLDLEGNVRGYCIEYRVVMQPPDYILTPEDAAAAQAASRSYVYRKEVTKEVIRTYKDNKPWDYVSDVEGGEYAEYPNPYGFAPAIWPRHLHMGGDHGEPIIWASLAKIDQLNEVASLGYDQIAKIIKAPILQVGNNPATPTAPDKRRTSDRDNDTGREKIPFVKVAPGTELKAVPLELGEALEWMRAMQQELEADHPELEMFRRMREHKGDITGPGAQRMMGDVAALVYPAMQSYDEQSRKLWQMGITVAAMRVRSGAWGPTPALTAQQRKFLAFEPDAYERGDLDFEILPRPLIQPSRLEEWTAMQAEVIAQTGKLALGWSRKRVQREMGLTDKEIAEMEAEKQKEIDSPAPNPYNVATSVTH